MNKNRKRLLLNMKYFCFAAISGFFTIFTMAADASGFILPNLLIKGQNLSFECSNGLRFALYPDSGNSAYRKSIQNLSVMIAIGNERRFLIGQLYASNSTLEERPNDGLKVWFSGKSGEVSVSRVNGNSESELGRHCRRIK